MEQKTTLTLRNGGIMENMHKHVEAVPAKPPRTVWARNVAWAYAAILAIMAVTQLFAFEDFIPLVHNYWLDGPTLFVSLLAVTVVVTEIFALPFLLRMKVSPLMRWFGLVCSVEAALIWFKFGLIAVVYGHAIDNSGLFGSKIVVTPGWTQLVIGFVLVALAVVSVWGLWPGKRGRKSSRGSKK